MIFKLKCYWSFSQSLLILCALLRTFGFRLTSNSVDFHEFFKEKTDCAHKPGGKIGAINLKQNWQRIQIKVRSIRHGFDTCSMNFVNVFLALNYHRCRKSHKLNHASILLLNCKKCTNMQQPEKYDKLICPKAEQMSSSVLLYMCVQHCIVSIVRWLAIAAHLCAKADGKRVQRER